MESTRIEQSGSPRSGNKSTSTDRHDQLRRIARLTQVGAIGAIALLLAVVIGFQIASSGKARSGVTAFGVDIGGMDREEAQLALEAARDKRAGSSIWLIDNNDGWELTQEDLGLTMDIDGALDDAFEVGREGFGISRLAIVWQFKDQTDVAADRIAIRGSTLQSRIVQISEEINQPVIHPELNIISTGTYTYVNHQVGRDVNIAATSDNIIRALATGGQAATVAVDETQPDAYDTDYAHARTQLDNILDEPVVLVAVDTEWTLTPDQIAYWLTVEPSINGEEARVRVDEGWVEAVVYEIGWATDRLPKTPRVWWDVGGALQVMAEGVSGQDLHADESKAIIMNSFLGLTVENRVDLPVTITPPPTLPEDLADLGIRSLIAEASTPYGGGSVPERAHNIELAASLINGTIIMPGQVFSFNAEIGPMTTDNGFQIAYGIANEGGDLRTVPSEAGGICQVSSTVFQPVFWSGYQIEVRSTHSYWIPSYQSRGYAGLDATVDSTTGMDFQWLNNSSTAVLLGAEANGDDLIIRLFGTPPDWTVEVDPPEIDNIVEADEEVVEQEDPTLPLGNRLAIERANDGFDIKIVRRVYEPDGNVRELVLETTYGPSRNVVLVGTGEDVESGA